MKILCLYGLRNFRVCRDIEIFGYVGTLKFMGMFGLENYFWFTVHGGLLSTAEACCFANNFFLVKSCTISVNFTAATHLTLEL